MRKNLNCIGYWINILFIALCFIFVIIFYKYNIKNLQTIIDDNITNVNIHRWSSEERDILNEFNNFFGEENYKVINGFNGDNIVISTKKEICISDSSNIYFVHTFNNKMEDFINEHQLIDIIEHPDISSIKLDRSCTIEKAVENIDLGIEYIDNEDLHCGTENILHPGSPKIICSSYLTNDNKKSKIGHKLIEEGNRRIIERGTKKLKSHVTSSNVSNCECIWDKIAFYESGGKWDINTGNGYYGGLQFCKSTWDNAKRKVGVDVEYPHLATREQQILVAEWIKDKYGWQQWPNVSRKLGLL